MDQKLQTLNRIITIVCLIIRWFSRIYIRKRLKAIAIGIFAVCTGSGFFLLVASIVEFYRSLPMQEFSYPLEIDMYQLIEMVHKKQPGVANINPINKFQFKYTLSNPSVCLVDRVDVLVMVKSTHDRFHTRQAIRQTWASKDCVSHVNFRTVFLLGQRPQDPVLEAQLDTEARKYQDIVQMNFSDNYFNNTYKVMMGIDFATRHCSNARFYMFVDDDYFVNPWQVANLISSVHPNLYPNYFSGYVFYSPIPKRFWLNKWFVNTNEYAFRYFPDYATAGTMVLSAPLAKSIAISMPYVKFSRFDDIFMGIILFKLHIAPIHVKQIYAERPDPITQDVITSHGFKEPTDLVETWRSLQLNSRCQFSQQRRRLKKT